MRWIAVLTLVATLGMGASAFACDGKDKKKEAAPKTTTQSDTDTSKTTPSTGK